jgi:hypothetical protein
VPACGVRSADVGAAVTMQEQFEQFHATNPHVYTELVAMTREAKARGKKVGIRMVWETLRWKLTVLNDAGDDFKLNDHLHSRYARLIMEQEPDLAGMFELRELKSA